MGRVNLYYIFTVLIIACGGIPKGYDEGGFSASVGLKSFKNDYHLDTNRKANITSFGVLGAAFGSVLCLTVNDRLGRLRSWQLCVLLWASGLLVQIFSSGIYGLILFARIWTGLGAGGLTVVAPLYLGEIAPAKTRGMIISTYMVWLLTILSVGFFVNYGASIHLAPTRMQYRLVQAIPLIPMGLAFIGSFFITDTPRWLASKERTEEALLTLSRLRGKPVSDESHTKEYEQIYYDLHVKHQTLAGTSIWTIVKEIATTTTYRERFLLAIFMQTVAQWSGGNGITYYIPQIFQYAGVQDKTSLITSGVYGIVKLVFTMIFTWGLVDFFGRRRCMLTGIFLQLITHIWMAIYMGKFRGHDGVVTNKSASDAAIASVFIYAVGWSIGLCTVQYIYATEIFPTRIRGVCYATNMMVHWFFQFAVVRTTPNLFASFNIWGAYVFWACICFIGLIGLGIWAPETKQVPMERMHELFNGKWWMGWRAKVDMKSGLDPSQEYATSEKEGEDDDSIVHKGSFHQSAAGGNEKTQNRIVAV